MLAWALALLALRRGWGEQALIVPVLITIVSIGLHGTWVVDDAGISWSYARNLADGHGPVPYPGGPVGEGFSDPLWVFLLAGAEWVGLRADLFAKTLGMLFGVVGVLLAPMLARRQDDETSLLVATALATSASWCLWSASGMETALCAVLLVGTTLAARHDQPVLAAVLAGLTAVCRPEGALLAAGALIAGRAPLWTALGPVAFTLGWWSVRLSVFGLWFPLPAYAKLSAEPLVVIEGLRYAVVSLVPVGGALAIGAAAVPAEERRRWLLDMAPLFAAIGFCLFSGGDWMRHGRFLAPVLPFVLAGTVPWMAKWAKAPSARAGGLWLCALALIPQAVDGIGTRVAPPLPMNVQEGQAEALYRTARSSCGDAFPSVATPDVGGVLWEYPNLRVADLGGLTEPDLVGRVPGAYWPHRLESKPVHAVYLHGHWPERTGLTDDAMRHAGYLRVCRRGEDSHAPTLWVHRRCDLGLEGTDRERVEEWCRFGAREPGGGWVPEPAPVSPAE